MNGIIYKITCTVNNKVYIGQTIRTMESRFERHIRDAERSENPTIHFQRAIKKYGRDAFKIEKIDEANSQQDLNEKERYWISFYKSTDNNFGYNSALGGEGGNTYLNKSPKEMGDIKSKISKSNSGRNNGASKQIKCKSVLTNEEHYFDTITECLNFFNIKNKNVIMSRVNNKCLSLWRNEWLFALENNEYIDSFENNSLSRRRGTRVILKKGDELKEFPSKHLAMNFLGYSCRQSGALLNGAIINGWLVSF